MPRFRKKPVEVSNNENTPKVVEKKTWIEHRLEVVNQHFEEGDAEDFGDDDRE